MSETPRPEPSNKELWEQLSSDTQEACEVFFGDIAMSEEAFTEILSPEEQAIVVRELEDRGLLERVTLITILQEQAALISPERRSSLRSLLGPQPPYTEEERLALNALDTLERMQHNPELKERNEKIWLRLRADFGRFVENRGKE